MRRPAWSAQFQADAIRELKSFGPLGQITPDWAWGGATGAGVRVAIIDSGVEAGHPELGDSLKSSMVVGWNDELDKPETIPDQPPRDMFGHGTACAGIIHGLAPEAELVSVRVLDEKLKGKGDLFAEALRWTIESGIQVVNLSLSTSRPEFFNIFHRLADSAYFSGVTLVSAAANRRVPSYPSLYSSVISVAATEGSDPYQYYYNPSPPVEFGAPGIEIRVAWLDGGSCTTTGNSFAAPHIAGLVARIKSKHPGLTPFQIKTILFACASNIQAEVDEPNAVASD